MPLSELLKNPALVAPRPKDPDDRTFIPDYIARRVRTLLADPHFGDQAKDGDITAVATPTVADMLAKELPKVRATWQQIATHVAADAAVHLKIDTGTLAKRGTLRKKIYSSDPKTYRRWLVRTIVYQAAADDITLIDPAQFDRLHRIVDRRLRIVERMIYDVGCTAGYPFNPEQVRAHPGGPWTDGYERLFEYPRVWRGTFESVCKPDATGQCSPPIQDWSVRTGGVFVIGPVRANPAATPSWVPNPDNDYELDYEDGAGLDPVAAVQQLFTPSKDYLGRNLMFCDHTMHALHLEALVFAYAKRNFQGVLVGIIRNNMNVAGTRWLRIYIPFHGERFLGGDGEPQFFDAKSVRARDLQVGDHLVVHNHPTYSATTVDGVRRLENALVVQTVPELLMQGHGSQINTQGAMWELMLGLFRGELDKRRADVESRANVLSFGANRVQVDAPELFSRRAHIDIVSADSAESVLAANRQITAIQGGRITYDGASVSSAKPHRVRRAHVLAFNGTREAIEGPLHHLVPLYRLMRRVPASASQYDTANQRADWYVTWEADATEASIAMIPKEAAFRKEHQLVEYTVEPDGSIQKTVGWFPLWEAVKSGGVPVRKNGKIVATQPVQVNVRNIAGWTWWFNSDPKQRDRVAVIRPKES